MASKIVPRATTDPITCGSKRVSRDAAAITGSKEGRQRLHVPLSSEILTQLELSVYILNMRHAFILYETQYMLHIRCNIILVITLRESLGTLDYTYILNTSRAYSRGVICVNSLNGSSEPIQ